MDRHTLIQRYWMLSLVAACSAVVHAGLQYVPVDMSPNYNVSSEQRDKYFPKGDVVLGGVPFSIPSSGNNEWTCSGVHHGGPEFDGTHILDIPVHVFGATNAYTLITTHWGSFGDSHLKVEFFGSSGAYYAKDLVGNRDIRDWNRNFTSEIDGVNAINVVWIPVGLNGRPDVMDMQIYTLPASFQDEYLDLIRLTDQRVYMHHQAILSGVTVATPEPATCLFLGLGIAILRGRKRF